MKQSGGEKMKKDVRLSENNQVEKKMESGISELIEY
jgi:hypothetical protein